MATANRTTVFARATALSVWQFVATAETVAVVALIAGWALLTWGVAALTVWQVWPISAGLFLLGCFGWRLLLRVFGDGLYTLHRDGRS